MKDQSNHYDHKAAERKWQETWQKNTLDVANIDSAKRPYYNLMMFPYPSAEGLHVGNMYAFTGSDIFGRFKRMQGFDVFEPIGLDGFGIHSENFALKIGRHPMEHAKITQKNFYKQLSSIGAMFDWTRTVETYDPGYYRWTQWLFVQMFKRGLAYRAKATVNWCPGDKTVLADEQVIDGKCERCGNIVEKRLLEQWFFKITAYAEKLLENTNSLDWSEKVLVAQRAWIGKKEGINITYSVVDEAGKSVGSVVCFTTRPDTNFGATFIVLAPEHDFISQILQVIDAKQVALIIRYVEEIKKVKKEDRIAQGRKKTGVFTGLYCINNLNGTKMPIYISDFVITDFGTGAVVGVPGHDKRDFEFAVEMKLPIKRVVAGSDGDKSEVTRVEQVQEEAGVMVNSDFLNGMDIQKAIGAMMEYLEKKGWGQRQTTYHLRDWLISRQRYWGAPIPMIYCKTCANDSKGEREAMPGWWTVPEDQLPVELPRIDDYKPSGDGISPLARHKEFYEVTCPGCGGKAVRETDVSDTFLDSSWYFLRYPSVGIAAQVTNETTPSGAYHGSFFDSSRQGPDQSRDHSDISAKAMSGLEKTRRAAPTLSGQNIVSSPPQALPWDPAITKKWLPVDMYTGGAEHSVLHLMYSRFVTMALHDMGYLTFDEPFPHFYAHGLIIKDGAKMSKSKGNVVNPDEYIVLYGADSLRLYLMFTGPFNQGGDFRDSAMEGMRRWIQRIWKMSMATISLGSGAQREVSDKNADLEHISGLLNKLIKKLTDDMEKRRYNTAIASMMEFTNAVSEKHVMLDRNELSTFLKLLAPFAPYVAEEVWGILGNENSKSEQSIHMQSWPEFDDTITSDEAVTVVIQINGKLRDTVQMAAVEATMQARVEERAKVSHKAAIFLEYKKIHKIVFVPGKLINFVVS